MSMSVTRTHKIFPYQKVPNAAKEVVTSKIRTRIFGSIPLVSLGLVAEEVSQHSYHARMALDSINTRMTTSSIGTG
ncbi:hypothetical protein TNCV_2536571 [Trichonephila clavipes]|nr:hypothetical protein TNCV_2536571 [Trichonephila clavipes]